MMVVLTSGQPSMVNLPAFLLRARQLGQLEVILVSGSKTMFSQLLKRMQWQLSPDEYEESAFIGMTETLSFGKRESHTIACIGC